MSGSVYVRQTNFLGCVVNNNQIMSKKNSGGFVGNANIQVNLEDSQSTKNNISANSNDKAYSGGFFGFTLISANIKNSLSSGNNIVSFSSLKESYAGGFYGWNEFDVDFLLSTSTNNYIYAQSSISKSYAGGFFGSAKNPFLYISRCTCTLNTIFGVNTGFYWGLLDGYRIKSLTLNTNFENFCNNIECEQGKTRLSKGLILTIVLLSVLLGGFRFMFLSDFFEFILK